MTVPSIPPSRSKASSVSRREFLRYGSAGGLGVWGLSRADAALSGSAKPARRSCIFVVLTGGPSSLETFDPKPDAPSTIRGPFLPIPTTVPGLWLSETLPQLSQRAELFSLLRSLTHDAAALHETGLQLIQTGRLVSRGCVPPTIGAVVASRAKYTGELAPFVMLPGPVQQIGMRADRGQSASFLGAECEPRGCRLSDVATAKDSANSHINGLAWQTVQDLGTESAATRLKYGSSEFGRNCLVARRMIEQGVPFVTINMFDSLINRVTWDCHAGGSELPTRLQDYRDIVCPQFDTGMSVLLEDLHQRGLLDSTLVVAVGEFGRTPKLNRQGGRDHWTGVWSALIAGCGFPGGQVLGASDPHCAAPVERPIHPAELVATIYGVLGIDPQSEITLENGTAWKLVPDAAPLMEVASV